VSTGADFLDPHSRVPSEARPARKVQTESSVRSKVCGLSLSWKARLMAAPMINPMVKCVFMAVGLGANEPDLFVAGGGSGLVVHGAIYDLPHAVEPEGRAGEAPLATDR